MEVPCGSAGPSARASRLGTRENAASVLRRLSFSPRRRPLHLRSQLPGQLAAQRSAAGRRHRHAGGRGVARPPTRRQCTQCASQDFGPAWPSRRDISAQEGAEERYCSQQGCRGCPAPGPDLVRWNLAIRTGCDDARMTHVVCFARHSIRVDHHIPIMSLLAHVCIPRPLLAVLAASSGPHLTRVACAWSPPCPLALGARAGRPRQETGEDEADPEQRQEPEEVAPRATSLTVFRASAFAQVFARRVSALFADSGGRMPGARTLPCTRWRCARVVSLPAALLTAT